MRGQGEWVLQGTYADDREGEGCSRDTDSTVEGSELYNKDFQRELKDNGNRGCHECGAWHRDYESRRLRARRCGR